MRIVSFFAAASFLTAVSAPLAAQDSQQSPGYTDTPKLPSGWRVHDSARPHPPIVDPGPAPKDPLPVPADATVLFGGDNLDAWQSGKGPAKWKVENGYMEVRGGGIRTKQAFGDCQLHVEWAAPAEVKGDSQGRGNSGVFFLGRYEIQVLDSYDNVTYADGQAAAMYGQFPPLVNACRKPGEWQTYDIVFRAPRFTDDGKAREAGARDRDPQRHRRARRARVPRPDGAQEPAEVSSAPDEGTDPAAGPRQPDPLPQHLDPRAVAQEAGAPVRETAPTMATRHGRSRLQ